MEEIVTLASIGNGAALELFDHELKRVIGNIADPNTSAKTKRAINIKVVILTSITGKGALCHACLADTRWTGKGKA